MELSALNFINFSVGDFGTCEYFQEQQIQLIPAIIRLKIAGKT